MSVIIAAVATHAAPVVLSVEADRAHATVAALSAAQCAPTLEGFYRDVRALTPDTVDADDVQQHGPATIERLWQTRRLLQTRLQAFHHEGTLSRACVDGARRADLAARYLTDHLYQAHPDHEPWLGTEALPSIDDLRSGDVLVTRGDAITSAGIAHIGQVDAQFSHNAMVYVDPTGQKWTIEAYLERGAVVQPLEDFLGHGLGRIVVLRHPDAALAADAARRGYARIAHGAPIPYDEAFRSDDDGDELFCSEIAPWAFALAGGPTDLPLHPTVFQKDATPQLFEVMGVTGDVIAAPADLLYDPRFDVVAEWRDVAHLEDLRRQDAVVESVFHWMERDGYTIDPTWANRATVDVGLTLRRTPLLGQALAGTVHPDGDRTFLVAGLALQQVGDALFTELDATVGDERPTWDELKAELEEIRARDEAVWLARPRKAVFHRVLHTSK